MIRSMENPVLVHVRKMCALFGSSAGSFAPAFDELNLWQWEGIGSAEQVAQARQIVTRCARVFS